MLNTFQSSIFHFFLLITWSIFCLLVFKNVHDHSTRAISVFFLVLVGEMEDRFMIVLKLLPWSLKGLANQFLLMAAYFTTVGGDQMAHLSYPSLWRHKCIDSTKCKTISFWVQIDGYYVDHINDPAS